MDRKTTDPGQETANEDQERHLILNCPDDAVIRPTAYFFMSK